MTNAVLHSIQVGRIAPLGPDGVASGFVKTAVDGPIAVTALGLVGDEQADLTVHRGPEKAVYAYPASHYAAWVRDFPQHEQQLVAGGLGENLTIDGWTEADLCVGDVHSIGTARLQVCQPRQPCFKLALHFADSRLPKAMVRNGRAGWYYRVIEQGVISPGELVVLIDRPNRDFRFDRLVEIVNFGGADRDELRAMAVMAGLSSRLRTRAAQALADGASPGN